MSEENKNKKDKSKNTELNPPNAGKTVHSKLDDSTKDGVQYKNSDKNKKNE